MNNILSSASKIVFIIMALGVVFMTLNRILDAKDFMILASMVFSYYFTTKSSSVPSSDGTTMGTK